LLEQTAVDLKLVIVGIDHTVQDHDETFKKFLLGITESEHIAMIGEEHPGGLSSVANEVARSMGIPWVQIDMTTGQRVEAGIEAKLRMRTQLGFDVPGKGFQAIAGAGGIIPEDVRLYQPCRYAPIEDGVRERFWLARIAEQQTGGVALIVCGAVHARKVAEKAQQKGYETKLFFFPETPGSELWVTIEPQLF
jgi:hypothetical protein